MIRKLRRFIWLLPFTGFLIGYLIPIFFLSLTQQKTPNVVGKPIHEALMSLSHEHLSARLIREQDDAVIPAGTVIQQVPSPYKPIKINQTVSLIIAKKPQVPQTPNLLQKKIEEINSLAQRNNANTECIFIPSANPSSGCLAQSPAPQEPLLHKTIVTYFSSKPNVVYIMPHLIGLSLCLVNHYLDSQGIRCQVFSYGQLINPVLSDNNLTIISQQPHAGSIINLAKPPCIQLEVA